MEILNFMLLVFHRVLSGLKNFTGYRKWYKDIWVVTGFMMIYTIISVSNLNPYIDLKFFSLPSIFSVISVLSAFACANSFTKTFKLFPIDIHLWETITTASYVIAMFSAGVDIIYILCSVPVSMVFHKGLINISVGRPFIDKHEITDDLSGKTYTIPLLGIRIPRWIRDGRLRIVIASIACLYIILNETIFHISFDVFNLMELLR